MEKVTDLFLDKELMFSVIFAGCITWFGMTYLYILRKIQKHYGQKNSLALATLINNLSQPYKLFLSIQENQGALKRKGKLIVISNIISFIVPCLLFTVLIIGEILKDL